MMTGALIFSVRYARAANGFSPLDDKQGLSALQRMVVALQMKDVSPIVVLTQQRINVEQHLAHMGVVCMGPDDLSEIDYPEYFQQAFSFFKIKCQQIFLASADYPLFSVNTITQLLTCSKTPAQPIFQGRAGYPLLATLSDIEKISQAYHGYYEMDTLLANLEANAQQTNVPDDGITSNLSKKTDWEALIKKHEIHQLRPISKFMIAREQIFLGPGSFQLLEAIELTDSVRSACKLIGLSYSKGWQMIRIIEDQAGFSVVERQKGGQSGGFACLSSDGKALLEKYSAYVEACTSAVEALFQEYFIQSKEEPPHDS